MHGAAVQAQSPANPSAMHQHVTMTLQTTTRSSAGQQAGIKKNCGHQEQSTPKPHRAPSPLTNTKKCQPPAHATACTDAWPDTACNKTATHTDTRSGGPPRPQEAAPAHFLPRLPPLPGGPNRPPFGRLGSQEVIRGSVPTWLPSALKGMVACPVSCRPARARPRHVWHRHAHACRHLGAGHHEVCWSAALTA